MPGDLVFFRDIQTPRRLSHLVRRDTCTRSVIYRSFLSSHLEKEAAGGPGLFTVTVGMHLAHDPVGEGLGELPSTGLTVLPRSALSSSPRCPGLCSSPAHSCPGVSRTLFFLGGLMEGTQPDLIVSGLWNMHLTGCRVCGRPRFIKRGFAPVNCDGPGELVFE